jgi:hypothetical protein
VELDGSRAKGEGASYLFAGKSVYDLSQDETLSRGQIHWRWRRRLQKDIRDPRSTDRMIGDGHSGHLGVERQSATFEPQTTSEIRLVLTSKSEQNDTSEKQISALSGGTPAVSTLDL